VSSLRKAVLASCNRGKLKELDLALSPLGIELLPQSDFAVSEADETACTFVENALIKARHASEVTGLAALADDSGLCVDALRGAPGIYSARYAATTDGGKSDQANIDKLMQAMQNIADDERSARFVCSLVWLEHAEDPEPLIASAHWRGSIARAPYGGAGFGYDPVFFCPQSDMTAAQLGSEGKRAISHRGKAIVKLQQLLRERYA